MPNVNTLLDEHVVLKYECVDRVFGIADVDKPTVLDRFCARFPSAQRRPRKLPRKH